jgi:hypothetical protein
MQKWQVRPSLIARLPQSACSRTFFSSNSPSLQADERASRPPPRRQPRQSNSRQASAKASRDVQGLRQGLRGMAPAGFARPPPLDLASTARTRTRSEKQPRERTRAAPVYLDNPDAGSVDVDEGNYEEPVDLSEVDAKKVEELRELLRQVQLSGSSGDDNEVEEFDFVGDEHAMAREGEEEQGREGEKDQLDVTPQKEFEMIEAIESHFAKPTTRFAPKEYRAEELINNRIATLAGPLGSQSEIDEVTGRMARRDDTRWVSDAALARQLMAGRLVKFADAREKQRIVALAEQMSRETAQKCATRVLRKELGDEEVAEDFDPASLVEVREVGFMPVSAKVRENITNKVTRGQYEKLTPVEGKGLKQQTMAQLARSMRMNESYTPTAEKSMLEFIEKLWPKETHQAATRKRA